MTKYYSLINIISMCTILFTTILLLVGCAQKPPPVKTVPSVSLEDAPDSVYGQSLDAFNVGTVQDNGSTFISTETNVSDGLYAKTTIQYSNSSPNNFTGTMTINLRKTSAGSSKYVLNISKSFASNINQLSFNVQPDQVIQSDPIVAWNVNKDNVISIKSDKVYPKKSDMVHALAQQTFVIEYEGCEKILSFEESSVCEWRLVQRYKDEPFMKDFLANMNLASHQGAALSALMNGTYDMCVKFLSGDEKNQCLQTVFRTREYECRSAADPKDCVRNILWPLGLNNIRQLCGFIADPDMQKECQGTIDSSRCDELQDDQQKAKCFINIARTTKNVKDCDKLDIEHKDDCLKYIGTDNNNADACMTISDPDTKDECIALIAIQTKNKDLCEQIQGADPKGLCQVYLMAREGKIDKTKCDNMQAGWIKDMCNSCYAISIKDMDTCNLVNDTDSLHLCQMTVGLVLNDSSVCQSFKEESDTDLCYNMFGLILDKKYCDKIVNEEMRKDCQKTPLPEKLKDNNATNQSQATTTSASGCPYNPPASAHKYDQESETGGWMTRYALPSGASVGLELFYYDTAKTKIVSSKCYNLQGQLDGPFTIYNQDGSKQQEGSYKDGQMDGTWKQWRQGTLESLNTYKDGKPNGPVETYITDAGKTFGHLSYSGSYNGALKEGDWKYYNGVTGALEEEATFQDDCKVKDKTYYEDGSVESEKSGACNGWKFTGTSIGYTRPDSDGKQGKTTCQIVDNEITSCV